jgi:hypothetical protein
MTEKHLIWQDLIITILHVKMSCVTRANDLTIHTKKIVATLEATKLMQSKIDRKDSARNVIFRS